MPETQLELDFTLDMGHSHPCAECGKPMRARCETCGAGIRHVTSSTGDCIMLHAKPSAEGSFRVESYLGTNWAVRVTKQPAGLPPVEVYAEHRHGEVSIPRPGREKQRRAQPTSS